MKSDTSTIFYMKTLKQITLVCIVIGKKVNNLYTSCFVKIEHFNWEMFGIALYYIQWYNNFS